MGKLINIDNGGTLTDIWVLDGKKSWHTKTITTPWDLSKCFFEGLKKVAGLIYGEENLTALLQSTDHIRYSTTQGTNALIMRKGPRLGLILPKGFDDTAIKAVETDLYTALMGERIGFLDTSLEGEAWELAVAEVVNRLSADGANRIVVGFDGPDYLEREARLRRAGLKLFPRHLLGAVPMLYAGSLSSDQDTVRRIWTAINNAFLHPAMERFLYNAENQLREHRTRNPLLIYGNDGYSGRVAKTVALKTYSSGPRGGMESARAYADYYGFDRFLSMDVGGTSTDIGLVENGEIRAQDYGHVEGVECSFPLCDIVSIGVGGGSIFRVKGGRITVGPDSVGGAPGPACFGMGGKEATITDALLIMGLLDPKTYFGGEMALDKARARTAITANVVEPLGISVAQAVHDMLDTWAGDIARGLADYTELSKNTVLSAFGGGGPMGVLAVAEAAGLDQVLIPRLSAVFSAHGIGFSDIAHAHETKLDSHDARGLKQALGVARHRVERDMFSEGFEPGACNVDIWLKVDGKVTALDAGKPVLPKGLKGDVIVGVRLRKQVNWASLPKKKKCKASAAVSKTGRSLIQPNGSTQSLPVYQVEAQKPGAGGSGPAIIEEAFWSCLVRPGWAFEFTINGDILFNRQTPERYTKTALNKMLEKDVVKIANAMGLSASVDDLKADTIAKILDAQK